MIDIPETKEAAKVYVAQTQSKIINLPPKDTVEQAGLTTKYNDCNANASCIQNVIAEANLTVLKNNNIPKEFQNQIIEQKTKKDIIDISSLLVTDPGKVQEILGTSDPATALKALNAPPETLASSVKDIEKRQVAYKVYFDLAKPLTQVAKELCGGGPLCLKELAQNNREQILKDAGFDASTIQNLQTKLNENKKAESIVNERINLYVNASREQQAQAICGDNPYCQQNFKPEMILTDIGIDKNDPAKYQQVLDQKKSLDQEKAAKQQADHTSFLNEVIKAEEAKATYIKNNGGSVVGYKAPFSYNINDVKEAQTLNDQTTKALAVFVQEKITANKGVLNTLAPDKKNPSNTAASDELARQFAKLIASDPSQLDKYYKTFTDKPAYYQAILDSGLYRLNPTTKEANATLTVATKDSLASTSIKGLTNNGKVITDWNQVDNTYKQQVREQACNSDKSLCVAPPSRGNPISSDEYNRQLALVDNKIPNKTDLLQKIYDKNFGNIVNNISTSFSNVATVDNPLTQALYPELVKEAKTEAKNKGTQIKFVTTPDGSYGGKSVQTFNQNQLDQAANEYINRRLVETTYTRGTGIGGAMASATLATMACSELGPGAVACGVAGGTAAALANIVPVLGEATQSEIAAEQQAIKNFKPSDILNNPVVNTVLSLPFNFIGNTEKSLLQKYGNQQIFNNDTAAGLIQSVYSNQGAASNTVEGFKLGGAMTRKDNSFALYNSIQQTNAQMGVTTKNMFDPSVQAAQLTNIKVNKDFDALANTENKLAYTNLVVSMITGGVSGGAGASVAKTLVTPPPAETILGNLAKVASNKFTSGGILLNAGNSVLNLVQTGIQTSQTIGYTDTPEEIALQTCLIQNGSSGCGTQQQLVDETNKDIATNQIVTAFLTDTAINVGQEIVSGTIEFNALNQEAKNTTTPRPTTPTTPTDNPIIPTDSTFITPALAEQLNSYDPQILNGNFGDTDSITLTNIIKSSPLVEDGVIANLSSLPKQTTADTSIVQAAVIYKDLPDTEFRIKLKEQGFSTTDANIALEIKNSGRAEILLDYRNQMIEGGATIQAQNDYFETGSQKLVQDAKKLVEAAATGPKAQNLPDATPVTETLESLTGLDPKLLADINTDGKEYLDGLVEKYNDPNIPPTDKATLAEVINSQASLQIEKSSPIPNSTTTEKANENLVRANPEVQTQEQIDANRRMEAEISFTELNNRRPTKAELDNFITGVEPNSSRASRASTPPATPPDLPSTPKTKAPNILEVRENIKAGSEYIAEVMSSWNETSPTDATRVDFPTKRIEIGRIDPNTDNPNIPSLIADQSVSQDRINLVKNDDGSITANIPLRYGEDSTNKPTLTHVTSNKETPIKPGDVVTLNTHESITLSKYTSLYFDGENLHVLTSEPKRSGFFTSNTKTIDLGNLQNEGNFFYPGDSIKTRGITSETIPPSTIDGQQVYYKLSNRDGATSTVTYTDMGVFPLFDGPNPLPRTPDFQGVIEFGTLDSSGNFVPVDQNQHPNLWLNNKVVEQELIHYSPSKVEQIVSKFREVTPEMLFGSTNPLDQITILSRELLTPKPDPEPTSLTIKSSSKIGEFQDPTTPTVDIYSKKSSYGPIPDRLDFSRADPQKISDVQKIMLQELKTTGTVDLERLQVTTDKYHGGKTKFEFVSASRLNELSPTAELGTTGIKDGTARIYILDPKEVSAKYGITLEEANVLQLQTLGHELGEAFDGLHRSTKLSPWESEYRARTFDQIFIEELGLQTNPMFARQHDIVSNFLDDINSKTIVVLPLQPEPSTLTPTKRTTPQEGIQKIVNDFFAKKTSTPDPTIPTATPKPKNANLQFIVKTAIISLLTAPLTVPLAFFAGFNIHKVQDYFFSNPAPSSYTVPATVTPHPTQFTITPSPTTLISPTVTIAPTIIPTTTPSPTQEPKQETLQPGTAKFSQSDSIWSDIKTPYGFNTAAKAACGPIAVANILCLHTPSACPQTPQDIIDLAKANTTELDWKNNGGLTNAKTMVDILVNKYNYKIADQPNQNPGVTFRGDIRYTLTNIMKPTDVLWIGSQDVDGIRHHTFFDGYTLDKNGVATYKLGDRYSKWGEGVTCQAANEDYFACSGPSASFSIKANNQDLYVLQPPTQ